MADEKVAPDDFACRELRFWAQFTEQQCIDRWGLNERQIPLLKEALAKKDLKLRDKEKEVNQQPQGEMTAKVAEADGIEKIAIEVPADGVEAVRNLIDSGKRKGGK